MKCVNALNGLLLISTMKKSKKMGNFKMCQCPQRASTHFYSMFNMSDDEANGVNALNGLLLISTNEKDFLAGTLLVSMPSTSFYSFLR